MAERLRVCTYRWAFVFIKLQQRGILFNSCRKEKSNGESVSSMLLGTSKIGRRIDF